MKKMLIAMTILCGALSVAYAAPVIKIANNPITNASAVTLQNPTALNATQNQDSFNNPQTTANNDQSDDNNDFDDDSVDNGDDADTTDDSDDPDSDDSDTP